MMCYNHRHKNSVGMCKHCARGLCEDCISPALESLACKNRCEDQVRSLDHFVNKTILSRYNATFVGSILVGVLMVVLGFFVSSNEYPSGPYDMIFWILAGVFFLNALRYLGKRRDLK